MESTISRQPPQDMQEPVMYWSHKSLVNVVADSKDPTMKPAPSTACPSLPISGRSRPSGDAGNDGANVAGLTRINVIVHVVELHRAASSLFLPEASYESKVCLS